MSNLFLEPSEIERLTCRRRRSAQVRVLREMGLEHKVRPDGSVAILHAYVMKVFDGTTNATERRKKSTGPNWDAI